MTVQTLDIRVMAPAERAAVERLVAPDVLARRIEAAEAGQITFWIAWLGDVPVGHVKVQWQTSVKPDKYADLPPGVPVLEWLGVAQEWRGGGIGTRLMEAAEEAARELEHRGVSATVWDVRVVRPLDSAMLADAARHRLVLTVEDGVRLGGAGTFIADALGRLDLSRPAPPVVVLGTPLEYISQAKPAQIHAELGLDGPGIAASVVKALEAAPFALG